MKLLVLSSRFPLPLEKGDKLRLYHQIRYLSKSHEIILVSLAEKPFDRTLVKELQVFCQEIYVIPHDRWQNWLNALRGLFYGMPVNVGYFFMHSTQRKIEAIIEKTRPDAIYIQLLRMVPYVKNQQVIDLHLDYMDAFSLRVLRRSQQTPGILGWLWKLEAKLLIRYERTVANRFKNRFVIAHTDKAFLKDHGVKQYIDVLPNGVDTGFFQVQGNVDKIYDLVFVGNMSYHPNILAAQYLVNEVARPLRKKITNLKILIAGADPDERVKKLQCDWVTISGFMSDIRMAYESGKIFVAPIFVGSGIQNKILEAMSMELPCITSPQVITAIGGIEEIIFGADDPQKFQVLIERLLQDEMQLVQAGKKARAHLVQYFDWASCCKPLDKLETK